VDLGRFCFKGRENRRTGRRLAVADCRVGEKNRRLGAQHLAIPVYIYISAFKKASEEAERGKSGMVIGRGRALSEPVGARKSETIKILIQAIFRGKIFLQNVGKRLPDYIMPP
jgi:hypothetical protein